MAKQIVFGQEAREALRRGVEKAARAIRPTLGPRGRSVVFDKSWGAPQVSYDGSSVTDEIELTDPYENMGARLLKEAASKTSDDAGDGTTTSALLADEIFRESFKLVVSGANPMALARGIRKGAEAIADKIKSGAEKITVKDRDRLVQVGSIASKGNREVGEMLADAFAKSGAEGAISVEEGKGIQTEIKVVEGMQFDRGFLSPHFVTNPTSVEAVLEQPYLLIYEEKLSSAAKLIPLMEKLAAEKASLLVIAEDVEGDALATLVVNKLRGILPCVAVKAPGYGDRRKAMLQDIAILTKARPIFKDLGIDLERVTLKDLGRAKKVIADNDNTTILEGAGSTKEIEGRCDQIRRELEESDSDYDREKLQERLAKLSGGVAQINVGAATETELKQRKQKVEDALAAVRSALADGLVEGGGVALLRAAAAAEALKLDGDEALGASVVRRCCAAPLGQLAENAGFEPTVVRKQVEQAKEGMGFDVTAGKLADMKKAGIVDPAKVVATALLNAASVAAMMVTADCLVADEPKEEEDGESKSAQGG
jgi:chaperonin GroEL